ncbi:MAG: sugar transferase, partial [Anaerolineales bacterium]
MSVLEMISAHDEDWFKKFDPQKRILTGQAYLRVKRVMDLFLVVVTLPLWLPLIGIIALIIRITSPGAPVVFRQLRTGKGGRRFNMYKFRTMVHNAEELKVAYAHLNELRLPDFKIT